MFENKEVQELTKAVRELVATNQTLVAKLETHNKNWAILADFVQKNSGERAAFGVTR